MLRFLPGTNKDGFTDWDSVYYTRHELGKRDFQRLTADWDYAGCTPEDQLVPYVLRKLALQPVKLDKRAWGQCVRAAGRLVDLVCAMYHPGDDKVRKVWPTATWAEIIAAELDIPYNTDSDGGAAGV